MSALLKRFWTDHRLASVTSLALLFLGLMIKPWTLVLVLAVAFGGPLLQRLESLSKSPLAGWRRGNWVALALLIGAVSLALTGKSGGQGALILALLPVAWVLVTDRGILQGSGEDESTRPQEPLTLSRPADEEEQSERAESKIPSEIPTAETPVRLIGSDLLAKIKELGDVGKSDLVRACGYFSNRPDGSERLNFTDFYEALLEAKGIETSSSSSSNSEDAEEPTVDFDVLWAYFQEGGGDIWNEDETVYLGTFEGDPGTYIVEVNGPDDYGVPYCTGREDLPRVVEAFIDNGGSISDLLKALGTTSTTSNKIILPEDWEQLENSEVVERLKTSVDISDNILRALSGSDDWEVRQAVAWHENTPTDVLEVLAEDGDSDVRRATQERSLPSEWRTKSEDEKVSALQAADVPLEVIQALATSERWTLRQAVAWSPSTPESILEKLKDDEDDDVKVAATTERQLPLDWRFLSGWDKAQRLAKEEADLAILEILVQSRDSEVRRAVALHPATPERLISVLKDDDNDSVKSGVRERELPESWKSLDEDERVTALTAHDVSESVLDILARSNSWTIRQAVATNTATSVTILQELSGDDDSDVSSAAKKTLKQKCLPEDWRQLDESDLVERLKTSPDVSAEILRALSGSDDWSVRQAVAWHDNTPADVIEALAQDDDSDVTEATLERRLPQAWRFMSQSEKVEALKSDQVSIDIIEHLASSQKWKLRQAVAWSPSTPGSILEQLKQDEDDDVKEAATTEHQLPVDWRFLSSWEKVERLGEEPTDLVLLDILSKSRSYDVRRAVALHPGTPEHLISALREDDDDSVQSGVRERDLPDSWKSIDDEERISALKSDDVPESVLLILARSNSWTIRQAVALSPGTPDEILERLSGDDDTDVQSAVRERGLPEDWKQLDEDGKVEQLKGGYCDPETLAILAKSGRWTIREAVAKNPGVTVEILRELASDSDSDVEKAAKKALKKKTGAGEGAPQNKAEQLPIQDPDKGLVIFASPLQVWDEDDGIGQNAAEELTKHSEKFFTLISECSGCWGSEYVTDDSERCSRPFFVVDPKGDCLFSVLSDNIDSEEDRARVYSGVEESLASEVISRNGRIYACVAFTYDHGDSLIEFEDFDREESEDGDSFENIPTIARQMDQDVEVYLRVPEGDGNAETVYYGSWDTDGDLSESEELSFEPHEELLNAITYGSPFSGLSNAPLASSDGDDEEHSIYIKTEPGGSIRFGALDSDQIALLQSCITAQELTGELSEIGDNSSGQLNECDGVVNSGDEGDFGNEGTIVYSTDQPALGPDRSDDGTFKDGIYVVLMRLSKCSIEFEFTATGGFDEDEFEEISVPVCLPEEIVHGLYGHPDFNIITGFRFRGESVEEYEGEVEDRGYDDQLTFFAIKDGVTTILYSNYNGDEEWCDADEAKGLMSSFL